MVSVTEQRLGDQLRVRVTRWTPGSPYPQTILVLDLDVREGESGRERLTRALQAVLDKL